nr:putative late blight resistance protein homolog R1B-16 isoform X1 [Ipomoea batatas]
MELSSIYLAKGWTKHIRIKVSLLRLRGIFNEAVKQIDYLKKELIEISEKQLAKGPSQGERITGVSLLGSTSSSQPLEELSITGWFFNHIPCSGISWATSFLPNLKKLKFIDTYCLAWGGMELIGMLPNLEVLKLKHAIDRKDTMWEPSEEGFRQLKRLVIEYTFLERWNAVGDHFPMLECLELRSCYSLQEIPSGFADITTLALIQLNLCWDSVLASAKLIQEEQYNNYGNALLVRSENIKYSSHHLTETQMAYAAVTSLKETLHLHFLQSQSQSSLPLLIYKPKMLSLHTNLSFLQEILEKSEIAAYDDAGEMKDLDAEIRDAAFKAEARIEMELTNIYPAKGWMDRLACLLRLHGIFNEAIKQTDYLKEKLIKIESEKQLAKGPSQRGLLHGSTSSQPADPERENNITVKKLPFDKRKSQHLFSKACPWISIKPESYYIEIRSKCFDKFHSLHSVDHVDFSIKVLCHFKLLRVVDMKLSFWNFEDEMLYMANLVHLRYLALSLSDKVGPLQLKLFEHWNMQSFIVRGCSVILDSSNASAIWKMPLLRNFYVDGNHFTLEGSEVVHRNIETISWLRPKCCREDLFTRIPNLKKLGIQVEMNFENENSDGFYNFVHLGQLEKLSINKWYLKLPDSGIPWATGFLPNLKKLKFFRTYLSWNDMRVIGMLPNLEVLKLVNGCAGEEWEPSEGGFRQLKRLVIESRTLEDWNAMGDHFPVLQHLELNYCDLLRKIPIEFADITTLKLIQLKCCWDSVLTSAKLIQDEQRSYGNEALLVRSIYTLVSSYPYLHYISDRFTFHAI